jgi:ribosomal protein S18 acetylase RimI-like enzyme
MTAGLAVIAGLFVSPDWNQSGGGEILLRETIGEIRRRAVERIESQFLSFDSPWLTPVFERQGFRPYWREFLRLEISRARTPMSPAAMLHVEPWRETDLDAAAAILQAAYAGGVEAEIHKRYRTIDGCRVVLEDILVQGSCGRLVAEASALARRRGEDIGLIAVTETAPHQGHIPQVAVLPAYQRQGVGQLLLGYSVSRLAERHFDTLSLIVSRTNDQALRLYHANGFQAVLSFPVFIWER